MDTTTRGMRDEAALGDLSQPDQQPPIQTYPLALLKGVVIFPGASVTLSIGREKTLEAVKAAYAADKRFVAVAQRDEAVDDPGPADAYDIGALVEIKQFEEQSEQALQITVHSLRRVRLGEWEQREPFARVAVTPVEEEPFERIAARAMMRHAGSLFEKLSLLDRRFNAEDVASTLQITAPGRMADEMAARMSGETDQQQDLLETLDPLARLEKICVSLGNEIEIRELENKIRQKVRHQVDKNQREYYLKEQLRAIQEELGGDQASEIRELRDRVAQKQLPEEARSKVTKELDRLERMPPHSAEQVVLRNYIDWMLALPWTERTEDRLDMAFAQKTLDNEHYGLEKVKERIIEFLAVRQLRMLQAQRQAQLAARNGSPADAAALAQAANANKGPILCLIGPPGVGKTSLGHSIAHALGRTFVRISLGGVHDEAEIRGHRRTYVGALPGRIIQAMRTAGVVNPVFLLDEIDKLAADYRGDPAAALLEVLDPEQNNSFSDHYLETPYDLSQVFFICTGNSRYQIPRALADRMDIIELPGYTEEEKVEIGRGFVLPKVLNEHGLSRSQVQAPTGVMRYIISRYTREAGVRSLERQLATICRKAARRIVLSPDTRIRVTAKNVEQYLGAPRYLPDKAMEVGQIGVATGLAWTSNGGALLPVEVVTMPGKGGLMVTGQLGDVMQESARAALSYIRSRADELDLPEDFPGEMDIHIHLPEGAIPKDGPSAGITMALAIISALTRRPVRSDIAMTGEITLRGRVLPIGGLKEKALAAHRVGIRQLIVPEENEKDLAEIPEKIRAEMRFTLAGTMDDVIRTALLERREETPAASAPTSEEPAAAKRRDEPDQEPTPPAPAVYPLTEEMEQEAPPPLGESPQQPEGSIG
ncbi:MAG TPA: endopeptidase La [Ktedonobacterales bacterium]|nr:endopeptidase La [Ktedonobacterales bacterium]